MMLMQMVVMTTAELDISNDSSSMLCQEERLAEENTKMTILSRNIRAKAVMSMRRFDLRPSFGVIRLLSCTRALER